MLRTLVIGYGNLDRQDDGVAYHVVNALRQDIGQERLSEEETGLEELGTQVDSVFVTQLAPELLDIAADYDQVVFVDAHVCNDTGDLHSAPDVFIRPVQPEYTLSPFTHHFTPAMFLALLQAIYRREPVGHVVSVRGYHFDFQRDLSAATQALVEPAARHVLQLLLLD